jgi:hypothetical protein
MNTTTLKSLIFQLADKIDHTYPDGNILFVANSSFWTIWTQIKMIPELKKCFHVEKHIIGQYRTGTRIHTITKPTYLVETLF